jgi:hypothetical protein
MSLMTVGWGRGWGAGWQLRVATSFLDHFPHAMLLGPSLEPLQEAVHAAHAAVRSARRPAD